MSPKARLTRDDWIRAANTQVIEHGVSALAVEPLATTLGATKGSFYWHFADRAALLDAVLDRWENDMTTAVIQSVDTAANPLTELLDHSTHSGRSDGLEWALISAAEHPQVGPAVERVHGTRLHYLEQTLMQQGLPASSARTRARVAYAVFLGNLVLSARGFPLSTRSRKSYVRDTAQLFDVGVNGVTGLSPKEDRRC